MSKDVELWIPDLACSTQVLLMEKKKLKLCLTWEGVMLFEFLVVHIVVLLGIQLNRYGVDLILTIFLKKT